MDKRTAQLDLNQIWQDVLDLIYNPAMGGQVTKATFDTVIKGSKLTGLDPKTLTGRVAVKEVKDQEWLSKRLDVVIARTLATVLELPHETKITLEYYVPKKPKPKKPPVPLALTIPAQIKTSNGNNGQPVVAEGEEAGDKEGTKPPNQQPANNLVHNFANIDYYSLFLQTGYIQVAHYINTFWGKYLGKTFRLWEYLQSQPIRKTALECGWTNVKTWSYPNLAKSVGCSKNTIRGSKEKCAYLQKKIKFGEPLQACCDTDTYDIKVFTPATERDDGLPCCYHWRYGWLSTLFDEHLIAVQTQKNKDRRGYCIQLQCWRVLPILTPHQVSKLREIDREDHERWLLNNFSDVLPLSSWAEIEVPSLVPFMQNPSYQHGKKLFEFYQPNTLKPTPQKSMNDAHGLLTPFF